LYLGFFPSYKEKYKIVPVAKHKVTIVYREYGGKSPSNLYTMLYGILSLSKEIVLENTLGFPKCRSHHTVSAKGISACMWPVNLLTELLGSSDKHM
jgi:hypothetical protein